VVIKMERLHRTIYLIEENPIVKSFENVEEVLKSIYGGRKVKTITTKRTENKEKPEK